MIWKAQSPHINTYGSRHTDAIVTENAEAAATFMNAGGCCWGLPQLLNPICPDGFRYGFGAEVGISTQKMPPPVDLWG